MKSNHARGCRNCWMTMQNLEPLRMSVSRLLTPVQQVAKTATLIAQAGGGLIVIFLPLISPIVELQGTLRKDTELISVACSQASHVTLGLKVFALTFEQKHFRGATCC